MGYVEFAYEVRNVTSYVVASDLIITVREFPYAAGIQAATGELALGPRGVATALANANDRFAVTEVCWMEKLAEPLSGLGEYLDALATQPKEVPALMKLREGIPPTGESGVDLARLLRAVLTSAGDASEPLKELVAEAEKYMKLACYSKRAVHGGEQAVAAIALSFPKLNTLGDMLGYGGLEFARATAWGTFLYDYLQGVADTYLYPHHP
jgi:hypothetical protein